MQEVDANEPAVMGVSRECDGDLGRADIGKICDFGFWEKQNRKW